jgi:hypothetical protein
MATRKATVPPKQEEGLVKTQSTALARPSFIKEGDTRGTENITSNDIKPPALRIAQSMSNEVKRSEPAYIEGLREGDFYNSLTKEIYGEGPIGLVIVNQLGHRHVEFAPLSEGGGVLDFNVPDGDPRTEFTTKEVDGKQTRVKPRATKFYDYLVLVVRGESEDWLEQLAKADPAERDEIINAARRELMTMSLKSTQLKNAVKLNTLLKGSKLPSFAHLFSARPVPEKKGTYSFYGWRIDAVGYVTEALYNEADEYYTKLQGKKIEVDTEGVDDGDSEDAPRGRGDDKVPF